MKILLVYPRTPNTFWGFRDALKFVSKKASIPPLGLLTVAAMLPENWEKKLIDMNVRKLRDGDLLWADYVFLSGMNVHMKSVREIIKRCNNLGVRIVAGGPLMTTDHDMFPGVDHYVLDEAELTLPAFLKDLENGNPQRIYRSEQFPGIAATPIPKWELLERRKYASMSIQYSRGCPFDCEFCSITILNGRLPRTKSAAQFLAELESLYQYGWRGAVFIVDDNFIGNRKKLKEEILPALVRWSEERRYPFAFTTEVSINLSDDEELVDLMVRAGFDNAFIGIETPNDESLAECGKSQNRRRDLIASVKKLQRCGLVVSGGFILGFDNDPPGIFEQQIDFIQRSGIATAMVSLLNAPSKTRLFNRLKSENRLIDIMSGNNMDGTLNFIPKMDVRILEEGYRKVLRTIYSQKTYYERVKTLIQEYRIPIKRITHVCFSDIKAMLKSLFVLGLWEKGKKYFWKLFFLGLLKYPDKFHIAIRMAIYGFHFRRVVELL